MDFRSCRLWGLLMALSVQWALSFSVSSEKGATTISVCQNKDCCQRFTLKHADLVQTLQHLLPNDDSVNVEATGCQSQCDSGPNMSINEESFQGVSDAQAAGAVLEMALDISLQPSLLAAVTVMEKAHKASSLEQKEKLLNSVIKVLGSSEETANGAANAHAHFMRAMVRLDQGEYEMAKQDAKAAIPHNPTAWRIIAEAEESLGNTLGAIEALTEWAEASPQFRTKINNEKARLSEKV